MLGGLELNVDVLDLVGEDKTFIRLLALNPWGFRSVLDFFNVEPCHYVLWPQFSCILLFELVTVYI
jgi:hypothetical protein